MPITYRIRNWSKLYEKAQSRDVKQISWVAIPNSHEGRGFIDLMARTDALEIFGCFVLILQVASKCPTRGLLLREDGPLTPLDCARICRSARIDIFEKAFQVLSSDPIKWIEKIETGSVPGACSSALSTTVQDSTVQKQQLPAEQPAADGRGSAEADLFGDRIPSSAEAESSNGRVNGKGRPSENVHGLVFQYLQENCGLDRETCVRASAMLYKRCGNQWQPLNLGCLMYALDQKPPVKDPIAFALGCLNGKSAARKDFEPYEARADALLKSFRRRVADQGEAA